MKGLTHLVRWYHTVTLSNEFKVERLVDGEAHDEFRAAGGKQDSLGVIDASLPLQSAVVKRWVDSLLVVLPRCNRYCSLKSALIERLRHYRIDDDPVGDIFEKEAKFNRRRIRVLHYHPNSLGF